jgi:hypothetical protein
VGDYWNYNFILDLFVELFELELLSLLLNWGIIAGILDLLFGLRSFILDLLLN